LATDQSAKRAIWFALIENNNEKEMASSDVCTRRGSNLAACEKAGTWWLLRGSYRYATVNPWKPPVARLTSEGMPRMASIALII